MTSASPSAETESTSDQELLKRFFATRSDAAFRHFVERHLGLVYATAFRRLAGDAHLAQDVAQSVFTDVARHAERISHVQVISGWLYSATCFAAAKAVRSEQRRRAREAKAAAMQESLHEAVRDSDWASVRPVIDDALGALKEADRHAILLRYFQARSFAEIGLQLKLTENAARMRVDRALEQLRTQLSKHGIASTAGALSTVLSAHASGFAPAGVAAKITASAVATAASGASVGSLVGAIGAKWQIAATATAIVVGGAGIAWEKQSQAGLHAAVENAERELSSDRIRFSDENARLSARLSAARAATPRPEQIEKTRSEVVSFLGAFSHQDATAGLHAPPPKSSGRTLDLRELDAAPRPIVTTRPKYPFQLRRASVSGEAIAEFVVAKDGTIRDLVVKNATHHSLEVAVREAMTEWKFEAGRKGGQPVETRMAVPFVFTLNTADPLWF